MSNLNKRLSQLESCKPVILPQLPDSILNKLDLSHNRNIKAECEAILNSPSASEGDIERAKRGIVPLELELSTYEF